MQLIVFLYSVIDGLNATILLAYTLPKNTTNNPDYLDVFGVEAPCFVVRERLRDEILHLNAK